MGVGGAGGGGVYMESERKMTEAVEGLDDVDDGVLTGGGRIVIRGPRSRRRITSAFTWDQSGDNANRLWAIRLTDA